MGNSSLARPGSSPSLRFVQHDRQRENLSQSVGHAPQEFVRIRMRGDQSEPVGDVPDKKQLRETDTSAAAGACPEHGIKPVAIDLQQGTRRPADASYLLRNGSISGPWAVRHAGSVKLFSLFSDT